MAILKKYLFDKRIDKYYKYVSEGLFKEFFMKSISKSKNLLITGKTGTGTRTLADSLIKMNTEYKVYDYAEDISDTKTIFPINETPYIVIFQYDKIESALSKSSDYQLEFDYAIHMINYKNIGAIKSLE